MNLIDSNVPVSVDDVDEPAANTDAVITYPAEAGKCHCISGIAFSYDGIPTAGGVKVEDGSGNTVFSMGVTDRGAGPCPFPLPKKGTVNTAMIITLAAGGAGVTGRLSVMNHWTQQG